MLASHAWDAALGQLELQMSRANFDTWLKDTFLVEQDGERFVIGVSSPFALETLEQRLSPMIRKALSSVVGAPAEVRFVVQQRQRQGGDFDPGMTALEAAIGGRRNGGKRRAPPPIPSALPAASLNPRYTFDTFVVGNSNRLAEAACRAVADAPGRAYNPLFIYGGVGLGKTHLMHAIGHDCLDKGLQVLYVSSETFTNEMIDSIKEHRQEEFRARYRRVRLLLVDDIQFIAGKVGTQEEFFHTFNAIHGAGGQIVISSDRPPKAISTLEDRLRSRFEWGLIADIQPPDLETRIAILRSKAQSQGTTVDDEVLEAIARKMQSNIRELEGSLNRVVALAQLTGERVTVQMASSALNDVMVNISKRFIKPETILKSAASYYGVTEAELKGKARDRRVMVPRQVAAYLIRAETELSLVEIGKLLGGRDHSTVLHSLEKMEADLNTDGSLARDVAAVREAVYAAST